MVYVSAYNLKLVIDVLPSFLGSFVVFCHLMGCLEPIVWCLSNWRCGVLRAGTVASDFSRSMWVVFLRV